MPKQKYYWKYLISNMLKRMLVFNDNSRNNKFELNFYHF